VGGLVAHVDDGFVMAGRDLTHFRLGESRLVLDPTVLPPRPDAMPNSFNDIAADETGVVYAGAVRLNDAGQQTAGDLVRVRSTGECEIIEPEVAGPNGVAFSPDGAVVYHGETVRRTVLVVELGGDGGVRRKWRFSMGEVPGGPDGLAVDVTGGIWVAVYGGGCVVRFDPIGRMTERIEVPATGVTNIAFNPTKPGFAFVTTEEHAAGIGGCLLEAELGVEGMPVAPAAI
jgi:sugar lactone lactonase YvrE